MLKSLLFLIILGISLNGLASDLTCGAAKGQSMKVLKVGESYSEKIKISPIVDKEVIEGFIFEGHRFQVTVFDSGDSNLKVSLQIVSEDGGGVYSEQLVPKKIYWLHKNNIGTRAAYLQYFLEKKSMGESRFLDFTCWRS